MKLHLDYCKSFGISKEEMEATEEHQGEFLGFALVTTTTLTYIDGKNSMHSLYQIRA